jgi:hypothetical protein
MDHPLKFLESNAKELDNVTLRRDLSFVVGVIAAIFAVRALRKAIPSVWKRIKKAIRRPALPSQPHLVDEVTEDVTMQCVNCKKNLRRIVLLPCHHTVWCYGCSNSIKTKSCPHCNAHISTRKVLYIS